MEASETHSSSITTGEPGNAFYKPSNALTGQHQVCYYSSVSVKLKNLECEDSVSNSEALMSHVLHM